MLFIQEYSVVEDSFGEQTVRVVVSDTINELLLNDTDITEGTDGYFVDVINADTITDDLEGEDGQLVVGEMSFSINECACDTDPNLYLLSFLLDAADSTVNRFIAIYMNPDFTSTDTLIDARLFIGKVDSAITGDDKVWLSDDYDSEINPLREYKFSATPVDIALLDKVNITERIPKENSPSLLALLGEPIDDDDLNIHETARISDAEIDNIFSIRKANKLNTSNNNLHYYYWHLGSLYETLRLLLDKTENILEELLDETFSIDLDTGTLGIQTTPAMYQFDTKTLHNNSMLDKSVKIFLDESSGSYVPSSFPQIITTSTEHVRGGNRLIELLLDSDATHTVALDDGMTTEISQSAIYIERKMLKAECGFTDDPVHYPPTQLQKNNASTDRSYSFQQYKTLTELIFGIAKAFRCYVRCSYSKDNGIAIKIIPQSSITKDKISITGATSGNLNLSVLSENDKIKYFGMSNSSVNDGLGIIMIKQQDGNELEQTKAVSDLLDARQIESETNGITFKRLLFSTSQIVEQRWNLGALEFYVGEGTTTYSLPSNVMGGSPDKTRTAGILTAEKLTTAIYVRTKADFGNLYEFPNGDDYYDMWSPAMGIFATKDGVVTRYDTLSDYINDVSSTAEQYYQTEIELTIPSWNGFKKNDVCSWKNLELGSVIEISETRPKWIGGVFVKNIVTTREYCVISIERSLSIPETKIKLQDVSRFAWGTASGDIEPFTGKYALTDKASDKVVEYYTISEGVTGVKAGMAALLISAGTVEPCKPHTRYLGESGRCIGIFLEGGDEGDVVPVQTSGRVELPTTDYAFDYEESVGKQLYNRIVDSNTNLSVNILEAKTADEDMIVIMGKIDSATSILLNIENYTYGG